MSENRLWILIARTCPVKQLLKTSRIGQAFEGESGNILSGRHLGEFVETANSTFSARMALIFPGRKSILIIFLKKHVMLKDYFKLSIRQLWKNKSYSFLNIFGLALGIACAGLIFLWRRKSADL